MDHITHTLPVKPPAPPETEPNRSFTLRIPKPNWQVTALLLIAVIAAFQTVQLIQLKGNVTAKTAATTVAASAASPSSDSSGLQSQVGGC
ncbi:MAG: hypothetical protein HY421_00800 [Candidatus Kerfeldbacteria bacterium]|nr:hypothetical protein [Candidatus Kerfeldbacteria bacterium]